ncbi:hypothetical protein LPB86_11120 [Pedobacter sp. MC2016-14]|uniref:hypothetical protein n=1 Tax=Pedobacter sp. MC2016-14 TaxID=2897327 RepID=UPI001E3D5885|nr:hypothetical protein [Pedobacter sp. MC2016-14]MCD0488785.1 hypothetical protein [Pedobacter sp. MC2016-14]
MTKKVIIVELLEAIMYGMPSWGLLPFSVLHMEPTNVRIPKISGDIMAGNMLLFLLRGDYTTGDALDYIRNSEEMQCLSESGKRDMMFYFFRKFGDDREFLLWKQQRIAMAIGIMFAEARKLNLSIIEHRMDLSAIKELNQMHGFSARATLRDKLTVDWENKADFLLIC